MPPIAAVLILGWFLPTRFPCLTSALPGILPTMLPAIGNERYRAALVAAARTAVERAVAGIHSATLATVEGECPVNVNRDIETPAGWWLGSNPRGFADHTMPVLAIRDAGGEYVAVLATADVQSSVLDGSRDSEGRRMASGDLFGFAAMSLERELGALPCCCQAPRATKVRRSAP